MTTWFSEHSVLNDSVAAFTSKFCRYIMTATSPYRPICIGMSMRRSRSISYHFTNSKFFYIFVWLNGASLLFNDNPDFQSAFATQTSFTRIACKNTTKGYRRTRHLPATSVAHADLPFFRHRIKRVTSLKNSRKFFQNTVGLELVWASRW